MIEIKSRFTGEVIFSAEAVSIKDAAEKACQSDADLSGAYLRGADLRGADLRDADLSGADLRGAKIKESGIMKDDGVFQITPIGSRRSTLAAPGWS